MLQPTYLPTYIPIYLPVCSFKKTVLGKLNITDLNADGFFNVKKLPLREKSLLLHHAAAIITTRRTVNYTQPAIKASAYFMSTTTHTLTLSLSHRLPMQLSLTSDLQQAFAI